MQLERLYDKAFNWIITKGPGIVIGILVLIVGLWLIKIFARALEKGMHKREFDPSLKLFLSSLIVIALRVMLVIAVMQIMGVQLTIFTAVVASFGVAAGLALSGTLQNFASGVLILLLKPFQVGDNILAQGQEGIVTSIQIFYTIVTTFDNKTIIVPNSKLSNEVIINISRIGQRRLDVELKFSYGFEIDAIKQIINKTVESSEKLLKKPKHRIGVSSLETDGFKLQVNVWVNAHGFDDTKMAFQENLIRDLKNAGVKLPGM